jgi:phosphoribosylglycinamide formyltransferase-1
VRSGWGVLISGNGGTLQSLLDCRDFCDVKVVIASGPQAYGIARAMRGGVNVEILPPDLRGKDQRQDAENWIIQTLNKYSVQKIFLAGFMKIISPEFIRHFESRIFNIHPSLLPKHKGLDAFGRALKEGEVVAGATVHHVAPEVDSGAIIAQHKFEIPPHRDPDLSHLWLHINEQRIMREALRKIAGKFEWRCG